MIKINFIKSLKLKEKLTSSKWILGFFTVGITLCNQLGIQVPPNSLAILNTVLILLCMLDVLDNKIEMNNEINEKSS